MADSVVRLRHTYGQGVQQQVFRERLAARMKTAKPEELCAVLEAIDDWGFHKGVACALLDTVTDEQELDAIESYLNEWAELELRRSRELTHCRFPKLTRWREHPGTVSNKSTRHRRWPAGLSSRPSISATLPFSSFTSLASRCALSW